MSAGEHITAPRCRAPVEFRALNRPRADLDPVCWRPAWHVQREKAAGIPVRHLSKAAWLYDLERTSRASRARREAARAAREAGMSDPAARVRP